MATHKPGCRTCERLLRVASMVFAEKGYQATTIAHICRAAQANVAAVNYHFGSKDGLYARVWRRAFEKSFEVYPMDGGLPANASAEQKLAALIRAHVHRVLDQGVLSEAGQILLMEMANPTEAIQEVFVEMIQPVMNHTYGIIKDLLGPEATEIQIHFCAMSVVHQCLAFSHRRCKYATQLFMQDRVQMDDFVERLAQHITAFSLAGIAGIRMQLSRQREGEQL